MFVTRYYGSYYADILLSYDIFFMKVIQKKKLDITYSIIFPILLLTVCEKYEFPYFPCPTMRDVTCRRHTSVADDVADEFP